MKNSIVSCLLGISLMVAAPAALADSWKSNRDGQKHGVKHHKQKIVKSDSRHKQWTRNNKQRPRYDKQHSKHDKHRVTKQINRHKQYTRHNKRIVTKPVNKRNHFVKTYPLSHYKNHNYDSGYSQGRGQRIRDRLANQARRINRGIDKGQLVHREVRKLRREQRKIRSLLRHFREDGRLNRHERVKLHAKLDKADRHIRNKRHNSLTRYNRKHHYPNNTHYEFVLDW